MLPARLVLSKLFPGSSVTGPCSLTQSPALGPYQTPGQLNGQVGLAAVGSLLGSHERGMALSKPRSSGFMV